MTLLPVSTVLHFEINIMTDANSAGTVTVILEHLLLLMNFGMLSP